MPDDWISALLTSIERIERIERKLDVLIAALAEADADGDEPERTLDDGRVIALRDTSKGLG